MNPNPVKPINYEVPIPPTIDAPVIRPEFHLAQLTLEWPDYVDTQDVYGFNIYRGTPWLKEPVQIGSVPAEARSFTCAIQVDRGDWFYFVRAFGRTESPNSNAVTIRQFSDERDGTNWVTYMKNGVLQIRSLTSTKVGITGVTGVGYLDPITADYHSVNGDKLATDSSNGPFAIYLPQNPQYDPAHPEASTQLLIVDATGSWHTHNVTLVYEGILIDGNAGDLICDVAGAQLVVSYLGEYGWKLYRK